MRLFKKVNGKHYHDPGKDPTSIGSLAKAKGLVDQEALSRAVEAQKSRLPLGQVMVGLGLMTHAQLEDLLFEQRMARAKPSEKMKITMEWQRAKINRTTEGLKSAASTLRAFAAKAKPAGG